MFFSFGVSFINFTWELIQSLLESIHYYRCVGGDVHMKEQNFCGELQKCAFQAKPVLELF